MKTAISVRDGVFEAAERVARELGTSRSELYTTAVREFVTSLSRQRVTERLNEIYGDEHASLGLDQVLLTLQSLSLTEERRK